MWGRGDEEQASGALDGQSPRTGWLGIQGISVTLTERTGWVDGDVEATWALRRELLLPRRREVDGLEQYFRDRIIKAE